MGSTKGYLAKVARIVYKVTETYSRLLSHVWCVYSYMYNIHHELLFEGMVQYKAAYIHIKPLYVQSLVVGTLTVVIEHL